MISLWLPLFIANCIPLSGDPIMDEALNKITKSDSLENYVEQKLLQRSRYCDLLTQRLWQTTPDGHMTSDSLSRHNQTLASVVSIDKVEDEQNSELFKISNKHLSHTKNGRSRRKKGKQIGKKEHTIFMQDIAYGIFGSCYNVSLFSDKPFIMIDRCPLAARNILDVRLCQSSRSIEEFDQCSIDMRLIPVSDNRGYIYKNIYCARCHGINTVTTWEVELAYNSMSALRLLELEQDQSLTVLGILDHTAQCVPSVYPLKPKGMLLCENLKYQSFHAHHLRNVLYPVDEQVKEEYPLSFTILMNFGINGKGHVFFSTSAMSPVAEHRCKENEIYDPNVQECRRVVCKSGYVLEDKKCIPKIQKYHALSQNNINDVTRSEYPLQITYRINVTRESFTLLEGLDACVDITEAFAAMLNISTNRILNFKMHLLNGTSPKKAMEFRQIATPLALSEHDVAQTETETDDPNSYCDTFVPLHDDSFPETNDLKVVRTVEVSFSLSPSKNRSVDHSTNEYIKQRLLIQGSFNFVINGTEFRTDTSAANTDVELDLWCTKGKKDQKFDNQFDLIVQMDNITGHNVTGVYVNSTDTFYPPGMYDLWVWVTGKIGNISDVSTNVYVFVCNMPKIENKNCARFQIKSSQYTRLKNSSLLLDDNRIVGMSEYEYVDEDSYDIQICVPDSYFLVEPLPSEISFGCGENYENVLLAEGYISFSLGIISIVVLAAVIVTYSIFEKLRNLPGLNTMSLTISLFLGELLFITSGSIQQNEEILCSIVGAFLHFIFLASFFWMNVMSYDVFRTFANKCILTRIRKKRRYFPKYSLYAWGAPALIVGVCCILDFTKYFPNVEIGYGGSSDSSYSYSINANIDNETETLLPISKLSKRKFGCWIQNPVAALVAFGSPMIAILFANAIMFVRTIICIRSVTKFVSLRTRRSSVSNAIGKHDVMLYVRMSTVMGFTWIFGLASSIVSSFTDKPTGNVCITLHTLGLLFIIFNCSQGLFIFGVFVCNRRVGALYKELFGQLKKNLSRQSSTTSLSTLQNVNSVSEKTHL